MAEIAYTIIGKGAIKVVVLHGWFGSHTVFTPLFHLLDTQTFTYLFVDYRGYGKSRELAGEYSIREISDDVLALVAKLGWNEFHLVGHSLGGLAMQRIMLDVDKPERIRSAIGICPVPACGYPLDEEAAELFAYAIQHDEGRYAILDYTTGSRLSAGWLNFMVAQSRAATSEAVFAAYLDAWTTSDFAAELAARKLNIPVLICLGEHDPAFPQVWVKETLLSWLPQAQLQVIANAGHYPMQETPVNLVTVMENFLRI